LKLEDESVVRLLHLVACKKYKIYIKESQHKVDENKKVDERDKHVELISDKIPTIETAYSSYL
jgi:hypothetical protein